MRKLQTLLLALVVIAIIAMVTKPSDESCKTKTSQSVTAFIKKDMSTSVVFVDKLIDRVAEKGISVEDKLLYKKITFSFKGKTKDLGWGAFGYVNVDTE